MTVRQMGGRVCDSPVVLGGDGCAWISAPRRGGRKTGGEGCACVGGQSVD